MKIGQGYDIHKLIQGRDLILGGVKIPYDKGLLGHSDADVLIHAIIDALLGAAALGDIGTFFPDSSEEFKNANSIELLKKTVFLLDKAEFKILNTDSTIICQKPKLAPYIQDMRKNIASALNIPFDCVSVKAKTKEGLDDTGKNNAIEAQSVCLIDN